MICHCYCHVAPDLNRAFAGAGVDVSNVIEAAAACDSCRNAHTPALLLTQPANAPRVVPQRGVEVVITPEGKRLSWPEYQRLMEKRPDTWRQQGDGSGEGAE